MMVINLTQGSEEWYEHRRSHFNASDAPSVIGTSKYKTRHQLLMEYVQGRSEPSAAEQKLFDKGHLHEQLARDYLNSVDWREYTPAVVVLDKLSASLDGVTSDGEEILEHKMINAALRGVKNAADLPLMYKVQMEQQIHCSGAKRCRFVATGWKKDELIELVDFYYTPEDGLINYIINSWVQFHNELTALGGKRWN